MDALTLLCNRFGEGSTLLVQLRAAGCRDCVDVERFDLDELTQLLGATRELALQLQREAHALSDELDSPAQPTPLRPESLLGLELEHCMHLRRLGVDSVEDLAAAGALELARALDIGVDRVMRWQACARRAIEANVGKDGLRQVTLTSRVYTPRDRAASTGRFSPNETGFTPRPGGLERDLASYEPRRNADERAP
jgi:hypothetical protein